MDTEKLKELLAAATPGPWRHKVDESEEGRGFMSFAGPKDECIVGGCGCCMSPFGNSNDAGHTFYKPSDEDRANAALIVAAVNALPTLLAELAAAREDAAAIRAAVLDLKKKCSRLAARRGKAAKSDNDADMGASEAYDHIAGELAAMQEQK